jgi:hypothetical protein
MVDGHHWYYIWIHCLVWIQKQTANRFKLLLNVIPVKTGIQDVGGKHWIPAFAGMVTHKKGALFKRPFRLHFI